MATKYNWTYNVGDLIPYEIASNVTISTANTVWVQRAMEGLIDADGTPEKPYHSIALGQAANKTYIVANGEFNEIINLTHHLIGDGFCLLNGLNTPNNNTLTIFQKAIYNCEIKNHILAFSESQTFYCQIHENAGVLNYGSYNLIRDNTLTSLTGYGACNKNTFSKNTITNVSFPTVGVNSYKNFIFYKNIFTNLITHASYKFYKSYFWANTINGQSYTLITDIISQGNTAINSDCYSQDPQFVNEYAYNYGLSEGSYARSYGDENGLNTFVGCYSICPFVFDITHEDNVLTNLERVGESLYLTGSASSSNSLVIYTTGLTTDELVGKVILITSGAGVGQWQYILSNTTTDIILKRALTTNFSTSSTYEIYERVNLSQTNVLLNAELETHIMSASYPRKLNKIHFAAIQDYQNGTEITQNKDTAANTIDCDSVYSITVPSNGVGANFPLPTPPPPYLIQLRLMSGNNDCLVTVETMWSGNDQQLVPVTNALTDNVGTGYSFNELPIPLQYPAVGGDTSNGAFCYISEAKNSVPLILGDLYQVENAAITTDGNILQPNDKFYATDTSFFTTVNGKVRNITTVANRQILTIKGSSSDPTLTLCAELKVKEGEPFLINTDDNTASGIPIKGNGDESFDYNNTFPFYPKYIQKIVEIIVGNTKGNYIA